MVYSTGNNDISTQNFQFELNLSNSENNSFVVFCDFVMRPAMQHAVSIQCIIYNCNIFSMRIAMHHADSQRIITNNAVLLFAFCSLLSETHGFLPAVWGSVVGWNSIGGRLLHILHLRVVAAVWWGGCAVSRSRLVIVASLIAAWKNQKPQKWYRESWYSQSWAHVLSPTVDIRDLCVDKRSDFQKFRWNSFYKFIKCFKIIILHLLRLHPLGIMYSLRYWNMHVF